MKKLKTVVAGVGRIGWQFHVPSIAEHEGFTLAAVCDPLEERLAECRERFGARGYVDYQQMLEAEKPDLVVVASPTHFHCAQAIGAMEMGCDVFLDKPMAFDLKEADAILAAKNRTGRKLMLYQPQRVRREFVGLQEILASGVLGDVYMIRVARSAFVHRNDWQAFQKYGGGMLNNYGAHAIDEALALAGSTARRVFAQLYRIASAGDADDVCKILIETENRITLDIDINMATALPMPIYMVFGQYGTALVQSRDTGTIKIRYFDPKEQPITQAQDTLAAAGRQYITAQPTHWHEQEFATEGKGENYYDKCYDYFARGNAPFVDVQASREVMRVINECRKNAGWINQ